MSTEGRVNLDSTLEVAASPAPSSVPTQRSQTCSAPPSPTSMPSGSTSATEGRTLQDILRVMVKMSVPVGAASFLTYAPRLIAIAFIGHRMGAEALSALGVAATTFNVVGYAIAFGLSTALDTFASQAFGRDSKSKELAILLQRGLFISGVASLPVIFFLALLSRPVASYAFSATIATHAADYLENAPLFLIAVMMNNTLSSICNCCQETQLPLYANIVSTLSALLTCYFFVYSLTSLVYANFLNIMLSNTLLIYYCYQHPSLVGVRSAKWWPLQDIQYKEVTAWPAVKAYLKVALPALIAVCAEWWAWEMTVFMAAWVSDEAAGVMTVIYSILTMSFLLVVGIARGSTVLVGNALGAGEAQNAKSTFHAAMICAAAGGSLASLAILLSGDLFWRVWTADPLILKYATWDINIWVALLNLCDGGQYTLQGVFRGAGKQNESASRAVVALWVIGIPMAYYLSQISGGLGSSNSSSSSSPVSTSESTSSDSHHPLGLKGVLIGMLLGLAVLNPLLLSKAMGWDWDAISEEAQKSTTTTTTTTMDTTSSGGGIVRDHHVSDDQMKESDDGTAEGGEGKDT